MGMSDSFERWREEILPRRLTSFKGLTRILTVQMDSACMKLYRGERSFVKATPSRRGSKSLLHLVHTFYIDDERRYPKYILGWTELN